MYCLSFTMLECFFEELALFYVIRADNDETTVKKKLSAPKETRSVVKDQKFDPNRQRFAFHIYLVVVLV